MSSNPPWTGPMEIAYGYGRSGLGLVPTFHAFMTEITPAKYRRPSSLALSPDVSTVPARAEVLYGTYAPANPNGPGFLPEEEKVTSAVFEDTLSGQSGPLPRLTTGPVPRPKP